ncbi:MAG: tRNA (adenosine(37)-N6)-threonylcarbamoyltransferase complex transferase subunit TsaD [Endomicrobiales bacterium]|nr:tRNA (adenosine(37)-N6)-threonylcarbamoyltransferase complex transferase subunit TsaD [Endomicrobiales bacterium]
MKLIGIETSCDETSAAVVENGGKILSNVVASQVHVHRRFSGVVPELASRHHVENVNWVIGAALKKSGIGKKDAARKISAVCYTRGPGLAGSLVVGQVAAQSFSLVYGLPLVSVNHIEGHLYSVLLKHRELKPPFLSLVVSGGHTELVIVRDFGKYRVLGGTRDDAAGEAYDKVAKLLKLDYPGGPAIDALSKRGNPAAVNFPRPYLWGSWDFSFSGIKTSVVNYVSKNKYRTEDVCASFQQAVVETLVNKTMAAAKAHNIKKIAVGGGVAANSLLRLEFKKAQKESGRTVFLPDTELCTDNAAMIACAGYYKFRSRDNKRSFKTAMSEGIEPSMKLEDWNAR